jgi:hypothetical protein
MQSIIRCVKCDGLSFCKKTANAFCDYWPDLEAVIKAGGLEKTCTTCKWHKDPPVGSLDPCESCEDLSRYESII